MAYESNCFLKQLTFLCCSNVDRVREFIKTVYVDKRYTVENSSDKPPRDQQVSTSR